jgi:hypothetical protein
MKASAVHWLPCDIQYTGPYQKTIGAEKPQKTIQDYFEIESYAPIPEDPSHLSEYPFKASFRGQLWRAFPVDLPDNCSRIKASNFQRIN